MVRFGFGVLTIWVLGGPVLAAPASEAWAIWDRERAERTAVIDHAAWQQFLDAYLVAGDDGVNRVGYRRVSAADRQALQNYLAALTATDPRDYPKAEQLAYWINLYNALTVEVVLRHPDKGSILRMGSGLLPRGPWKEKLIRVAGAHIALDDIEHRILRPIWQDHRIHYAVNCASFSCPNLAAEAYTGVNVERLLAQGERDYVNHPRGVRFDARGRLVLSEIYRWYQADFAADTVALRAYLSRHHETLAEALAGYAGRVKYEYDWSLNGLED